jgi:hypothetical protein
VDFSALVGGAASCRGCQWSGTAAELLLVPIQHDFAFGSESIITEMMADVRRFMSGGLGIEWLKFLLRWGFIEGDIKNTVNTVDRKKFSRYLAAIGHATLTAIVAERSRQAEEKSRKEKELDGTVRN